MRTYSSAPLSLETTEKKLQDTGRDYRGQWTKDLFLEPMANWAKQGTYTA